MSERLTLSARERDILARREAKESYERIAKAHGVTRERIRQIEKRALALLAASAHHANRPPPPPMTPLDWALATLPARPRNALLSGMWWRHNADPTLGDLLALSREDLLAIRNIGPRFADEIAAWQAATTGERLHATWRGQARREAVSG